MLLSLTPLGVEGSMSGTRYAKTISSKSNMTKAFIGGQFAMTDAFNADTLTAPFDVGTE
jgi:hypothetical protein